MYDYGLDDDDDEIENIEEFCNKLLATPVDSDERQNTNDCTLLFVFVFWISISDTFSPSSNIEYHSTPIAFPTKAVHSDTHQQQHTVYSPQTTKDIIDTNTTRQSSSYIPPQECIQPRAMASTSPAGRVAVINKQRPPPPTQLPPVRIARPPQGNCSKTYV